MTPTERLLLLLTADTVIAMAQNPCARVSAEALVRARHALDDEAFAVALGDGTALRPMKRESDAAVIARAREVLG